MPYHIKDIRNIQVTDYPAYLLDANIWIANLESSVTRKIQPRHQSYIDFVNKLVMSQQNLKAPKIIVLSLLISEVVNTYLRNVTMPLYANTQNISNLNFKKDYRPTTHCKNSLKRLWSDFKDFEDYIQLEDDDLKGLDFFQQFDDFAQQNSDFNDYYYYQWAKKHQIPIVTDDEDFVFEDVTIITANRKLLTYQ